MWNPVERYIGRSIALLIYFTGFPMLTAAIFSITSGSPIQAVVMLIATTGFFVSASLILEAIYRRGALRILAISSGWPFIVFLLFNLSVTAVYAHAAFAAVRHEASRLVFSEVALRVLAGYERIVPKLWVTAILYGSATLGFVIGLRVQRRARRARSRWDSDHAAHPEPARGPF